MTAQSTLSMDATVQARAAIAAALISAGSFRFTSSPGMDDVTIREYNRGDLPALKALVNVLMEDVISSA
jgi:hypothetical protein